MADHSVNRRLMLGAVIWIAAALLITGFVLTGLFRNHVEQNFDEALQDHLEEVLSFTDVDADGNPFLKRHPGDPEYNKPLSGWYWEFQTSDGRIDKSRSLWDQRIDVGEPLSQDHETAFYLTGPRKETLRAVARSFTLPDAKTSVVILTTGPTEGMEKSINAFTRILAITLTVLGVGLVSAAVLQIRYGIRPLFKMRDELAEVRAGRATRMVGPFAAEVEPMVEELNGMLDHNAEILQRARTHAGNLAHALKTPLAVLLNEANHMQGATADIIRGEIQVMQDQINRHLSKARAAGSRGVLGVRADVGETIQALKRTVERIYQDRELGITLHGVDGLSFQGERQDLEEMLGNLMDNACKWAKSEVRVHGRKEGSWLMLTVEDDGPGIAEHELSTAIDRGRRLDETTVGSGLGLSIVGDVAELYEGKLELSRSDIGGLAARLRLPAG